MQASLDQHTTKVVGFAREPDKLALAQGMIDSPEAWRATGQARLRSRKDISGRFICVMEKLHQDLLAESDKGSPPPLTEMMKPDDSCDPLVSILDDGTSRQGPCTNRNGLAGKGANDMEYASDHRTAWLFRADRLRQGRF